MPAREKQVAAIRALCGFWELLEDAAAAAPATSSLHLLDQLRRGDGRDCEACRDLFRLYDLAKWIEDVSGVEIDNAPMYARMLDQGVDVPTSFPVGLLEHNAHRMANGKLDPLDPFVLSASMRVGARPRHASRLARSVGVSGAAGDFKADGEGGVVVDGITYNAYADEAAIALDVTAQLTKALGGPFVRYPLEMNVVNNVVGRVDGTGYVIRVDVAKDNRWTVLVRRTKQEGGNNGEEADEEK